MLGDGLAGSGKATTSRASSTTLSHPADFRMERPVDRDRAFSARADPLEQRPTEFAGCSGSPLTLTSPSLSTLAMTPAADAAIGTGGAGFSGHGCLLRFAREVQRFALPEGSASAAAITVHSAAIITSVSRIDSRPSMLRTGMVRTAPSSAPSAWPLSSEITSCAAGR